jgi:hypothetical protein
MQISSDIHPRSGCNIQNMIISKGGLSRSGSHWIRVDRMKTSARQVAFVFLGPFAPQLEVQVKQTHFCQGAKCACAQITRLYISVGENEALRRDDVRRSAYFSFNFNRLISSSALF